MTERKYQVWTDKENEFLRRNCLKKSNAELKAGLFFMFGINRSENAVQRHISNLGLRKVQEESAKPITVKNEVPIEVYIPKIKPHMKTKELLGILGETFTLKDVARVTGRPFEYVRKLVIEDGGLPKSMAEKVRELKR